MEHLGKTSQTSISFLLIISILTYQQQRSVHSGIHHIARASSP